MQTQPHLLEVVRALDAASGLAAACTAGNSRAIRTLMMAMTTRSSISVAGPLFRRSGAWRSAPTRHGVDSGNCRAIRRAQALDEFQLTVEFDRFVSE